MRFLRLSHRQWMLLQRGLVMVLVAVTLSGCAGVLRRAPGKTDAAYKAEHKAFFRVKMDVRYNGLLRNYLVHLPPDYNDSQPLPLVVVLHGAFGVARSMAKSSGFSKLADEKRFIAIYPNGIGFLGNFQHWNAGHCCAEAVKENVDDVGFLTDVIEDACKRLAVDRRRIYMVGFSNGGMLAYRFAAEKGDLLAGFAALAATAGGRPDINSPEWSIPKPVKPLPVIAMHGLADESVPFKGGVCSSWGNKREYWSVMRSLKVWADRDGCSGAPITSDRRQNHVHVSTWNKCQGKNKVVLYTLDGWPHQWPGLHFSAKLDPKDPLYNFDAEYIIWDFFESTSR